MFSFDPVKTITCIDGGALVVKSQEEADALREMRLIGMGQPSTLMYQDRRAWTYDVTRLGYRYHMANLHAAIGLSQIAKMEEISRTRRAASCRYNERLESNAEVICPKTDFRDITPFLYYLRVLNGRREAFRSFLNEKGIDTGIHWQPGHSVIEACSRSAVEAILCVSPIESVKRLSRCDFAQEWTSRRSTTFADAIRGPARQHCDNEIRTLLRCRSFGCL